MDTSDEKKVFFVRNININKKVSGEFLMLFYFFKPVTSGTPYNLCRTTNYNNKTHATFLQWTTTCKSED